MLVDDDQTVSDCTLSGKQNYCSKQSLDRQPLQQFSLDPRALSWGPSFLLPRGLFLNLQCVLNKPKAVNTRRTRRGDYSREGLLKWVSLKVQLTTLVWAYMETFIHPPPHSPSVRSLLISIKRGLLTDYNAFSSLRLWIHQHKICSDKLEAATPESG